MKRNNVKKLLCTMTAIGLTVSALAGCGNGAEDAANKSSEAEKSTTASEQEVASTEAESNEESVYPDYLNLDGYRPIVKDGEEITLSIVCARDEGIEVKPEDMWITHFLKEVMNINVEVETHYYTQRTEPKNLMLASGEIPDLVLRMGVTNEEVVKYGVEEGMFLPLSDYFSEELTPNILATFEEYPGARDAYTLPNGKMYTLPIIGEGTPGRVGTIGVEKVFINMEYVKAAGWEKQPESVDEMLALFRDVKELGPEVFGVDEIYPIASITSSKIFEGYLRKAFGWVSGNLYQPVWDEVEQEIAIPCLQDKFRSYIELMNTLYTEGFLHPDYYTMDDAEVRAIIKENKAMYVADWGGAMGNENFNDYACAHPLASEYLESGISENTAMYEDAGILVSADTEHPEVILRLLDYIYSMEGSSLFSDGPQAGSEDTLGIIDGWDYDEESGTPILNYARGEHVTYSNNWNPNRKYQRLMPQILNGVENPKVPDLDPSIPGEQIYVSMNEVQGPHLVDPLPPTWMTGEQSQKFVDYKSLFGDFVTAELAKFVVGQRSLDEFEAFQDELMAMGGQDYLDLCKEIYANYER